MKPQPRRCAVYTRKSTEEGLDQDFNSIDAQREACLAYITSQKSEGWVPIKDSYDDGGFSGGNMERPSLQRLLNDVRARKIDIIVVYKIDRLSRTLVDFSKLVDLFDKYEVTFISITQSFNTTTSMGRLTMNILLSFAQFEREVTAERIRDKVAASKKKGIWMGGTTPTGYDIKNRLLIPNDQAGFIKMLYERYLELDTVADLAHDLNKRGIRSPIRILTNGKQAGGAVFTNGALRHILMNPIYIGKIRHKKDLYDGSHQVIIPLELWQRVQDRLANQSLPVRREKQITSDPSLLQGKLFDMEGNRYVPKYAYKNGNKYKYYISQRLADKYPSHFKRDVYRLPAPEIEGHVEKTLREQLRDPVKLSKVFQLDAKKHSSPLKSVACDSEQLTHAGRSIKKVVVDVYQYTIELQVSQLYRHIEEVLRIKMTVIPEDAVFKLVVPYRPVRATRETAVIETEESEGDIEILFDMLKKDIKNLVRGTAWRGEYFRGRSIQKIAAKDKVSRGLVDRLIQASFDY